MAIETSLRATHAFFQHSESNSGMSSERFPCLSPRETASNQDEWPHPVASPGYPNRQLTAPLLPTPLPFRWVPGQAPTIIGLRYKEEPPGAKSRLPISLAGEARKVPRKSVGCFRAEVYRLGSGTNSPRGIRGFSPRVAPCRSSGIRDTSTTSSHRRRRPLVSGSGKTLRRGKEKWANEHADASVVGSIFTFARRN